jgi:hypothetical protein
MPIPWKETLSEWMGCAGLGLIPLLCMLAAAFVTDDLKFHELLLSPEAVYRELMLFCVVTNAASIVLFVSKFNLLQVVVPGGRMIPTGFIFSILLVTLGCGFAFVVVIARRYPALLPMLSCMVVTILFSLWAERRIGIIARE